MPGCSRFTSLRLNRKGTLLLASSLDRYARLFSIDLSDRTGDAADGVTATEAQQQIQALPKASCSASWQPCCGDRATRPYSASKQVSSSSFRFTTSILKAA